MKKLSTMRYILIYSCCFNFDEMFLALVSLFQIIKVTILTGRCNSDIHSMDVSTTNTTEEIKRVDIINLYPKETRLRRVTENRVPI